MSDLTATFPSKIAGKIVKLKVKKGTRVGPGTVLCTYNIQGSNEVRRLKCNDVGTVQELCFAEGDEVLPG